MKSLYLVLLTIAFGLLTINELRAADGDLIFVGKSDIITYMDGRDFSNKTHPEFWTSMKTRLGVEKHFGDDIEFHVIFQDSRAWGQESGITANSKNVDLAQGWMKFKNIFNQDLHLQLGRFQLDYGNGFVIGASAWNYIERSFDGAVVAYKYNNFNIDLFYALHTASIATQKRDISPAESSYPAVDYSGYNILGLSSDYKINDNHKLSLIAVSEMNSKKSDTRNVDLDRYTAGLSMNGIAGNFVYNGDVYYQFGNQGAKDISAYAYLFKLTYNAKPWTFSIANETNSGTDPLSDGSKINTFNNYLGSKHRFFGPMDYFSDMKIGSNSLGVNNYFVDIQLKPEDTKFSFNVTAYYFISNQKDINDNNYFKNKFGLGTKLGNEIDLGIKYNVMKGILVEWISGVFMPGAAMEEIWKINADNSDPILRNDPAFMSYLRFRLEF